VPPHMLSSSLFSPSIAFPYPADASLSAILICNHAGKPYYFVGEMGGEAHVIEPVMMGGQCTAIPITAACKDASCFRRGTLRPCADGHCAMREVTAGVNIISQGTGSGICTVDCPLTTLMCRAATVAFISPVNCQSVSEHTGSHVAPRFEPPYSVLPLMQFPYPQSALKPSSVIVCNYSPQSYWYTWDDSSESKWKDGPGHALVAPLRPAQPCQMVETALSWHRGFVAPCPKGEAACFMSHVKSVTAGVNVLYPPGEGQSTCTVHCNAAIDVCKTASVVVISPTRCERVQVTAG